LSHRIPIARSDDLRALHLVVHSLRDDGVSN
jgi:hypothetical protein